MLKIRELDLMKELNKSLSNIDRIKEIIALRNQLLQIVKEKVTYDPATDAITAWATTMGRGRWEHVDDCRPSRLAVAHAVASTADRRRGQRPQALGNGSRARRDRFAVWYRQDETGPSTPGIGLLTPCRR